VDRADDPVGKNKEGGGSETPNFNGKPRKERSKALSPASGRGYRGAKTRVKRGTFPLPNQRGDVKNSNRNVGRYGWEHALRTEKTEISIPGKKGKDTITIKRKEQRRPGRRRSKSLYPSEKGRVKSITSEEGRQRRGGKPMEEIARENVTPRVEREEITQRRGTEGGPAKGGERGPRLIPAIQGTRVFPSSGDSEKWIWNRDRSRQERKKRPYHRCHRRKGRKKANVKWRS